MGHLPFLNRATDEITHSYSSLGFMMLVGKPVLVLQGYSINDGKHCGEQHRFELKKIEEIARKFAGNRSPAEIFESVRVSKQMEMSMDYLCYVMHRRLIRIDQNTRNEPDYSLPLDIEKLSGLITDACAADDAGKAFRAPEHRDIPLVSKHDQTRYELCLPRLDPIAA